MKNKIIISFSLIILSLIFVMGCSSAKVIPDIGIVMPEPEPLGPLSDHVEFEDIVKGKVWYSKLSGVEGDTNLDKVYQVKLQFNTTSKTFTKETYYWDRYGRTNTYKTAGYNVQKGRYLYGLTGNQIEYELTEDYFVNANSSRKNNTIDKTKKSVIYLAETAELINWDGLQYYEKQSLEKFFIGNFTNKREFTVNQ